MLLCNIATKDQNKRCFPFLLHCKNSAFVFLENLMQLQQKKKKVRLVLKKIKTDFKKTCFVSQNIAILSYIYILQFYILHFLQFVNMS